MSLPSTKAAGDTQLNTTSLQQQQASQRTQPVAQAAMDAGVSGQQRGVALDSLTSTDLAAGGAGARACGGHVDPRNQLSQFNFSGQSSSQILQYLLARHMPLMFLAPGGPQTQSSNGGSGGARGAIGPGGQPFVGARGSSSQPGNGGSGGAGGPFSDPAHWGEVSSKKDGEGSSSQSMEKKLTSVSSMSPQSRKRDRDSKKPTPRNMEQLGRCDGRATSAVKRAPKRKSIPKNKIIDTQKVTLKDGLYKVVSEFLSIVNKNSHLLTEEMINKNQELVDKLSIITRKDDKEIADISIDEMASAFKEFRECYTNVKRHLLVNNSNIEENLKTSVHQTCPQIDNYISTMSNHDIMQFQKTKQHFQSKVEEYKSLGITLPAEEVKKINRYEYTSGANLKTFKTLVDDIINKLDKLNQKNQLQAIKQDFQSKVEEYKSLGITLPAEEVKKINSYEYTSGANLTAFKTLVDEKINKLKDQYVEKVKAKLSEDLAGYREAENILKELNDRLDRVKTESLEEIKKVIKKCYLDIENRQARGELNVKLEKHELVIEGLAAIKEQEFGHQIFDDFDWK